MIPLLLLALSTQGPVDRSPEATNKALVQTIETHKNTIAKYRLELDTCQAINKAQDKEREKLAKKLTTPVEIEVRVVKVVDPLWLTIGVIGGVVAGAVVVGVAVSVPK